MCFRALIWFMFRTNKRINWVWTFTIIYSILTSHINSFLVLLLANETSSNTTSVFLDTSVFCKYLYTVYIVYAFRDREFVAAVLRLHQCKGNENQFHQLPCSLVYRYTYRLKKKLGRFSRFSTCLCRRFRFIFAFGRYR